jgi:hypothetical protein
MAAKKKPGLGRGLSSILAEEGRIGSNREMRQLIPTEAPTQDPDDHLPPFEMFGSPRVRNTTTPDSGEVGGVDIDYSTQYVGDARPPEDNYGQGPDRSTRVAAHKFVPHPAEQRYLLDRAGVRSKSANDLGTVYVKFHKRGDTYKYSHVPESIYNSFANSNSKGRFINDFLNAYKYGRIGSRDDRFHTDDF